MKAPNCYRGGFLSTLGPDMEKYMRMKRESGKAFARPSWDLRKFDQYCIDKGLGEPLLTRPFVDAWMASIRDLPPTSQEGLLSTVRGLADYIATNRPQSARIPDRKKQPYKPASVIASHLDEFIETKLSLGLSYVQEQRALHSFDRFCCSQHISKVEQILPELIDGWHGSRNRTPGVKDLRYVVREFCIFLKTRKGFNLEIIPQRFKESHPAENYRFRSAFAPLLEAFVQDKRDSGFSYDSERKILKHFDLLCVDHEVHRPELSKELVQRWSVRRPSESFGYRNKRISVIRQFAFFLVSLGHEAHVAPGSPHVVPEKPHIFKAEEIEAFFRCVDRLPLELPLMRLSAPVIFRFYYCLGLRLNEAVGLERKDVDLVSGKVEIRMAKNLKDRAVYLPDDLRTLAARYDLEIARSVPDRVMFFVSDVLGTKVNDTGLCRIFNLVWNATGFADTADKKPTIHSFRHTFVVRKLEQWYSEQVDYAYWLPYLSAHLGHSRLAETYSYIHLVDSAFPQIRCSTKAFEKMYPEVAT